MIEAAIVGADPSARKVKQGSYSWVFLRFLLGSKGFCWAVSFVARSELAPQQATCRLLCVWRAV